MWARGRRDCRARRRTTGVCGVSWSETSTTHRSGKSCGGWAKKKGYSDWAGSKLVVDGTGTGPVGRSVKAWEKTDGSLLIIDP